MDVRIAQAVVIVAYLCWSAAAYPAVIGKRRCTLNNTHTSFTCEP